jgi:hypothetical protein
MKQREFLTLFGLISASSLAARGPAIRDTDLNCLSNKL